MLPIYCSNGEWTAILVGIYIFDTHGEWIAWLDGTHVYTRDGMYAGYLANDGRILRQRVLEGRPMRPCPPAPAKIKPPSKVPLAPMFAELPWHVVDCFEEDPDIFMRISDLRPDWED